MVVKDTEDCRFQLNLQGRFGGIVGSDFVRSLYGCGADAVDSLIIKADGVAWAVVILTVVGDNQLIGSKNLINGRVDTTISFNTLKCAPFLKSLFLGWAPENQSLR